MKNLVLGVAKGYDRYVLEPFVNSCAKNCPSAELVLFVDDISDFTRDYLIRGGVLIENFPSNIKGIPNNTRWKIFRDFLDVHGDEYEQIFITDTRDVIFQADVFTPFKSLSNWLGYTTEADDIHGSKTGVDINYRWLADCFGKDEADKLSGEKIICCGTVIGSGDAMKIFCRELWKILQHKTTDIFDQAVTNYLIYNGLLPIKNLYEIDVDGGEIFTCGLVTDNKTRDGLILRGDSGIPAVVHQYDRHDELVQLVDKIYRDKDFRAQENFAEVRSNLEQMRCLLQIGKVNDAARFSMSHLDSADFDGHVDALFKLWEFVLKLPITPAVVYLELSAQNSLLTVKHFPFNRVKKLFTMLIHSMRNRRTILPQLKNFLAGGLLKLAEQFLNANAPAQCLSYLDMIDALEMPPDKNFYLLRAKANRLGGKKDEALAAYKKVLDLS